jgi:hypothetical protein
MRRDPFGDFFENLLLKGLEAFGKYYSSYRGSVADNKDPENIGRIKVKCPQLYGNQTPDQWIFPSGAMAASGSGIYWMPPIGAPIYLTCQNGDPRFPLWQYGWWLRDSMIEGAEPGVHILQTPFGHRIEMNDNDKFIEIKHPSGFHVKLYQDGVYIGKDDKNLGKFLDDLFELLTTTTTATMLGAQPFINVTDYTNLRTQIQQFLKTN